VIGFLVVLIVLPVAFIMLAASLTNEPWLIVPLYGFLWVAWPRKSRRSRRD